MKVDYPFIKKKGDFGYTSSLNFLIPAISYYFKISMKTVCMNVRKIAKKTTQKKI